MLAVSRSRLNEDSARDMHMGRTGCSSQLPSGPFLLVPVACPAYFLALFFTSGSCLFTMPLNGVVKRMRRSNMNDQFSM